MINRIMKLTTSAAFSSFFRLAWRYVSEHWTATIVRRRQHVCCQFGWTYSGVLYIAGDLFYNVRNAHSIANSDDGRFLRITQLASSKYIRQSHEKVITTCFRRELCARHTRITYFRRRRTILKTRLYSLQMCSIVITLRFSCHRASAWSA